MFSTLSTLFVLYILLFLLSLRLKDNSIVDIFWGFGFMIIAILSFFQSEQGFAQYIMTGLVLLWGVRLVSHIGFRKLRERNEDPRYAQWRDEWGSGWYFMIRSFLQVYMLQMVLMLVVAVPILVVNLYGVSFRTNPEYSGEVEKSQSQIDLSTSLEMTDTMSLFLIFFGTIIALSGFLFETIADLQLKAFLKIKKPGQIFMTGFYQYSRHPNYFGESLFWLGISLISLPYSYIGIIGWITITCLLLFVSGVPLQEARYDGRAGWAEYRRKTSVFVPWFPRE